MLTFNPEIYGSKARRSALADYLELLVLRRSEPIRKGAIADLVEQNEDQVLYSDHFIPVHGSRTVPTAGEVADSVFALLAYRSDTLGDAYPFNSSFDRIESVTLVPHHSQYLLFLGITVAHAYGLVAGNDVASVFEYAVERAVATKVGLGTAFWRHHLAGRSFWEAVASAAQHSELEAVAPGVNVAVSAWAKDEGLDVLGHLWWNDDRQGRWVFIGQATVGKSDTWEKKATDVRAPQWRKLLGLEFYPQRFLAVPHHIEADHWADLLYHESVLLDRLRLSQALEEVTPEEAAYVDLVLTADVEPLFPY